MIAIQDLAIPDVKLVRVKRHADARGYFAEAYVRPAFTAAGVGVEFIQDNEVFSRIKGTVRGLHFQLPPHAQAKLVRVARGRILDVAVDLRSSSPTFGRHVAVELDAEHGEQLLVPAGFAHGYCTREPDTLVVYKVDKPYAPDYDRGVNWSDPDLAIAWGVAENEAVLSDRDRALPNLRDLAVCFE